MNFIYKEKSKMLLLAAFCIAAEVQNAKRHADEKPWKAIRLQLPTSK